MVWVRGGSVPVELRLRSFASLRMTTFFWNGERGEKLPSGRRDGGWNSSCYIRSEKRRQDALPSSGSTGGAGASEIGGAAVDVDGLAGDGAGVIGAEEESGAGDFVGGLAATLQDRVEEAGE